MEFVNGDSGTFTQLSDEPAAGPLTEEVRLKNDSEEIIATGGARIERVRDNAREEVARYAFDPAYSRDHTKMADGTDAARDALFQRGYIPELQHFAHCIRTGARPVVGIDEAAAVFRVVWAMFETLGTGRRMELRK